MSHKKTQTDRAIIGRRIAAIIERSGLTQSEIARKLNTERNTIWRWCAGKAEPSPSGYLDLFEALRGDVPGLTLDALLGHDQHTMNRLQDRLDAAEASASKDAP